jgi:ferredoxin
VPAAFPADDLLPIASYLELDREKAEHRVPFVWAVDGTGHLHRLAITRRLATVCRDRLEFWRTLQELAGIRNEHVRAAVARAVEGARSEAAEELGRRQTAHAEELARAREAATEEGLAGLATFLLGLDPADLLSPEGAASGRSRVHGSDGRIAGTGAALDASGATATASSEGNAVARPGTDPAGPAAGFSGAEGSAPTDATNSAAIGLEEAIAEAWIDSVLCTSCNDCTSINSKLFVYDGNKQARIGDLHAGMFAQLVEAAEKCPARCIHPGEPIDPTEPDLESLRERAKPFN